MENREIATSRKITAELIGGCILWGIPFGIVYSMISGFFRNSISSPMVNLIASIILNFIIMYIIWKFSVKSTFKKRTLKKEDINKVIRNLIIFMVIISAISMLSNFLSVNKKLDQAIKYKDPISSQFGQTLRDKYNEVLQEAAREANRYIVIGGIASLIVDLVVLIPIKKEIEKRIEKD